MRCDRASVALQKRVLRGERSIFLEKFIALLAKGFNLPLRSDQFSLDRSAERDVGSTLFNLPVDSFILFAQFRFEFLIAALCFFESPYRFVLEPLRRVEFQIDAG